MAHAHRPNALDRIFFAIDEAWRRCSLPGVDIWILLECDGAIDMKGLSTALRALQRCYPAAAARLHPPGWLGFPRWDFRDDPPAAFHADAGRADSGADFGWLEELLRSRLDWSVHAPFQIYRFTSDTGDRLLFRWPHAFADARGGVTLIEELARLYDEQTPCERATSVEDELREDAGNLSRKEVSAAAPVQAKPRRSIRAVRLVDAAAGKPPARMGVEIRRLSVAQAAAVREASLRVCGVARFADFIRSSAIRALHELVGQPAGPNLGYSSMHLIDQRRKRDSGPVCHNVFSAVPVWVDAAIAADRRASADAVADALRDSLADGSARRQWRRMGWLSRIPTGLLACAFARSLRSATSFLPEGLANAPSVPLGFMGPLARPRTTFCGAKLVNILGLRPASWHAGFAINVNAAQDRMNIAAAFFEPHVPRARISALLDRYVELLLDWREAK
ncbi:MAG: hypothetical protein HZB38_09660 [Planctomycetes bacterium]|nr:hypothetical protein [Planctomycetota bacterium]